MCVIHMYEACSQGEEDESDNSKLFLELIALFLENAVTLPSLVFSVKWK